MKRRDSIKSLAGIGLFALLGNTKSAPGTTFLRMPNCTLTPAQTAGPFYLSGDLMRADIAEDRQGTPLTMVVFLVDADSCEPIPGALVEIWHCDVNGAYSGFANQGAGGNMDTRGMTFLRGGLLTDAEGRTEFTTIYPGWYPGRATHIHFRATFESKTYVTSQLYFPEPINSAVYTQPPYDSRGQNTTTNSADFIFAATQNNERLIATTQQIAGGYLSSLTIGITGVPTGIDGASAEPSYYRLDQNYPNPVGVTTHLPFSLPLRSEVAIAVYDILGNRLGEIHHATYNAGTHVVAWDASVGGTRLPRGNYFYRLTAVNAKGTFTQARYLSVAD